MRLATIRDAGATFRVGLVDDDRFFAFDTARGEGPVDMISVIARPPAALRRLAKSARCKAGVPLADVSFAAPVPRPPEFIGVGLNYRDHAVEAGLAVPGAPTVFNKQTSCVAGPHDDVLLPALSGQLDYEGELGLVIGEARRGMGVEEARRAIFGYVVVNDFSLRDVQMASPTHTMGKSFDTHGPFGPWIVTADGVPDPRALTIETRVNGVTCQRGAVADMVFDCATIVAHLARVMTIAPGTVVTTGTPAGVRFGRADRAYLRAGDMVTVEIAGIGRLANRVVAEGEASR